MASQGPRDPTTAASVDGGNVAWVNPNNALTLNTVYATADITNVKPTQYLQLTNYGFTIPAGSTINGIVVAATRFPDGVDSTFTDLTVQLIKGGVKIGTNKADTVNTWIATVVTKTYGTGTTDLWGTTWAVAEINAIDFGIAFQVQSNDPTDYGPVVSVDDIQITVYYTAGAGGGIIAWTVA